MIANFEVSGVSSAFGYLSWLECSFALCLAAYCAPLYSLSDSAPLDCSI